MNVVFVLQTLSCNKWIVASWQWMSLHKENPFSAESLTVFIQLVADHCTNGVNYIKNGFNFQIQFTVLYCHCYSSVL
jgi:hypothetical protein